MGLSRSSLAMFVVLAACSGAVNVGGPRDDAGSGANSSSSGGRYHGLELGARQQWLELGGRQQR